MEGTINIWSIIKQALKITWKNKLLWLWGFLAFLVGPLSEIESVTVKSFNLNQPGVLGELKEIIISSKLLTLEGIRGLATTLANQPTFLLILLVIYLLVAIISLAIFCFAVVGQGALVYQINQINKKQKVSLGSAVRFGLKNFWPVLFLDLIFKAVAAFLFYMLGILIFKNWLVLLILLVSFSILTIITSLITKLAIISKVLENLPVKAAVKKAVWLLSHFWFESLKLMLGISLVNLILFLILLAATLIGQVLMAFTLAAATLLGLAEGILLSVKLLIVITLILIILTIAIATTFHWVAWTLLFVRFKNNQLKTP